MSVWLKVKYVAQAFLISIVICIVLAVRHGESILYKMFIGKWYIFSINILAGFTLGFLQRVWLGQFSWGRRLIWLSHSIVGGLCILYLMQNLALPQNLTAGDFCLFVGLFAVIQTGISGVVTIQPSRRGET